MNSYALSHAIGRTTERDLGVGHTSRPTRPARIAEIAIRRRTRR